MTVTIVLQELLADFVAEEKETVGLKFKSDQGAITFWGELAGPNRNIVSLRNQKLPILIELDDPISCAPSEWDKKENGLTWSVPSSESFFIHNEF